MKTIEVKTKSRSYPVVIGSKILNNANEFVPKTANRAMVVTQDGIDFDVDLGIETKRIVVPSGEDAKSFGVVENIFRHLAKCNFTRRDVIVGLGGGTVTDVAGFTASIYHRGTHVLQVPTTLLAQVDASIGGKTGINIKEGKNLVGAIWQPTVVLCDLDTLQTLPPDELKSGLGEVAKCVFLGAAVGIDTTNLANKSIEEQVAACVELKATVVAADENDTGLRNILNYGHTFAHAWEKVSNFSIRHGEAVSVGINVAAHLAYFLGRIDKPRLEQHRLICEELGLRASAPLTLDASEIVDAMQSDKKSTGGLDFVLDGPNGVEMVRNISHEVIKRAITSSSLA